MLKVGDIVIRPSHDGHTVFKLQGSDTRYMVSEVSRAGSSLCKIRLYGVPYWWKADNFIRVPNNVTYKNKEKRISCSK